MHPNSRFAWDDRDAMLAMVRDVGFARLFAQTTEGPRVAHVPVLVTETGAIRFHLANNNALTASIEMLPVLALIEGPNAYVSANWYADVRGAVPTWNYMAVECEGGVTRLDREGLVALLDASSAHFEPKVMENWSRAKMEPQRFDAMLGAITGFELTIDAIRGTRKLSQNQVESAIPGLRAGFAKSGAEAMADLIADIRA
jgi:transcriptional regulator